jgi:hypothetical protein
MDFRKEGALLGAGNDDIVPLRQRVGKVADLAPAQLLIDGQQAIDPQPGGDRATVHGHRLVAVANENVGVRYRHGV